MTHTPTFADQTVARLALVRSLRDEDGSLTVWNLFWLLAFLIVGGLAVDVSNAWRLKAQLQVTADAAVLAAATQGEDQAAGRAIALETALKNMPDSKHGEVLNATDVVYGGWDGAGNFDPDAEEQDAVRVVVRRTSGAGNEVGTFLLGLVDISYWDIGANAIAATRSGAAITCGGATIITNNFLDTGGGNELSEGVCFYGNTGVRTGGNDLIEEGVRIGSADISMVDINYLAPGSASEDEIKFGGNLSPVILPELDSMFSELWDALSPETVTSYSGDLLPDFIFDAGGTATVVHIDQGWWQVQPGDLESNTIYVVHHGMGISGGIDATNVAIIADGQIGVGGGPSLNFDEVYFFGSGQLNFSGDILWGNKDAYCDDLYFRAYLFSKQSLTLGGFGAASGAYGVVGAAPRFSPGGAMKSSGGLYFEANDYTALGGDMEIEGCGEALSGDLEITGFPTEGGGSYLVH